MWVEFVVGSFLVLRVFLRFLSCPPSTKTNISKFQFDQDIAPLRKPTTKADVVSSINIVIYNKLINYFIYLYSTLLAYVCLIVCCSLQTSLLAAYLVRSEVFIFQFFYWVQFFPFLVKCLSLWSSYQRELAAMWNYNWQGKRVEKYIWAFETNERDLFYFSYKHKTCDFLSQCCPR